MGQTTIEWTSKTWNPTVGCTRIGPDCKHCYAFSLHDKRHAAHTAGKAVAKQYAHPFTVLQTIPERLNHPLSWKKPQRIFVNSVSDLFHKDVPFEFIDQVFAVMAIAKHHTFQVLTKRTDRMAEYLGTRLRLEHIYDHWHSFSGGPREVEAWPLPNVWTGFSAGNQETFDKRVSHMASVIRAGWLTWLSAEPLLGPLIMQGREGHRVRNWFDEQFRIRWVVCGGESGPGARPCRVEWIRNIVEQCKAAKVACFVKQLGSNPEGDVIPEPTRDPVTGTTTFHVHQVVTINDRKGGDPLEWPEDLRVREFPATGKAVA